MVIEVNKKSLVVQSNSLVEAKYRLSVEEQKIIKILISQIQREDEDFKAYEFHIRELAKMLGMEHKDPYRVLEKITERLMSRVLKFSSSETNTILQVSWLSSTIYKKGEGTVILRFDPNLKPLLLQLQSYFTKYELGQVLQFKGQYTIRFFEFRKSFLGKNKKVVEFPLNRLREAFGLGKNEYQDFDNFRRRVIEPARIELLEKTGQSFVWEAIRQGRGGKVVGMRFVFDGEFDGETEKEKEVVTVSEGMPKIESQETEEIKEPVVVPTVKPESFKQALSEGEQLLVENGISESVAALLAEQYGIPYLREKIALANLHPEYIKNKAGFLIQAIKENWVDSDIVRNQQKNIAANAEKRREETRKRVKGIWDRYRVQRDALGLKKYEKMASEEIQKLKEEFLAGLKDIFRSLYRKKENFGYEDGMFRSFFLNMLELPSFENFLVAEGITLSGEEREILEREFIR
jgi:plasmid replication initiation protein